MYHFLWSIEARESDPPKDPNIGGLVERGLFVLWAPSIQGISSSLLLSCHLQDGALKMQYSGHLKGGEKFKMM